MAVITVTFVSVPVCLETTLPRCFAELMFWERHRVPKQTFVVSFRFVASALGVIRSFSEKLFFVWLLDDYFFVSLSFALFSFSFYTLLRLFFRLSILFIDFLACFLFFCYLWSFSELHLHCPQKRCRLLIAQFYVVDWFYWKVWTTSCLFDFVARLTFFQSSVSGIVVLRQLFTS